MLSSRPPGGEVTRTMELTEINAEDTSGAVPVSEIELVETLDKLAGVVAALSAPLSEPVALDTEADSLHHYSEKTCLLQLGFSGRIFIVDPLAPGMDLKPFLSALSSRRLILHGADYDLRLLHKGYGFTASSIFDTMIAAQLLGEAEFGLAALLSKRLGIRVDKSFQRADWSERPLPEELRTYAAADVVSLHRLMDSLLEDLGRKGRLEWHEEDCARVVVAAKNHRERDPASDWRVKGTNALSNRERAFARALWRVRDERARELDRPPFRIFTNERLLEAAKAAAKGERDPEVLLQSRRGYPAPLLASVKAAVISASSLPSTEWPGPKRETEPGDSDPALKKEMERLKGFRERLAKSLAIDPGVLASKPFLTALAKVKLRTGSRDADALAREAGVSLWRTRLLMEAAAG